MISKYLKYLLLALIFSSLTAKAENPKHEMRAVWLATVWGIDWPSVRGVGKNVMEKQKAEMRGMLDSFEDMNLTTVFFQVRSMGDAMYPSSFEPWSSFISDRRGVSPLWDPLDFVVEECHKRGLECYAWVNPFRWSSGTNYDSEEDRRLKERGWLLSYDKYTVFNPGYEEVREYIVNICRELVENYPIDGLVFDDYFYPNRIPETADAPDYQLWQSSAPWMSFGDWRRANVHKTVADIHSMIFDIRPELRFGISPAGVAAKSRAVAEKWGAQPINVKAADWQYSEIYSEPLAWLYQGIIDFISPQIYWPTSHELAPHEPIARWWSETVASFGCHFYNSVTLESLSKDNSSEARAEILRQLDITRSLDTSCSPGIAFYSARYLPKISSELKSGKFASKAISPRVKRFGSLLKEPEQPAAPRKLRIESNVLHWVSGQNNEQRDIMQPERYAVYAFPKNTPKNTLYTSDGSGIDARWLVKVVYSTEIPVADRGLAYAVTALSGYSVESDPAFLN